MSSMNYRYHTAALLCKTVEGQLQGDVTDGVAKPTVLPASPSVAVTNILVMLADLERTLKK